ncbi:hypothetical protein [Paenibacillus chitinolyticus]|uniref:hypothetical protein n=1 Tax=Paenibacillus chitinolyticus TaxID=79263 RepID=UPI001C489311|nr:hypothetical protein [Paenibacillus chitinolyticus]MBV6717259.1 hypothetical protein [Paenibacillus chitinolyticus]
MEVFFVIENNDENYAVYLVYKLLVESNTPVRQFLDVHDSKEEAEEFIRKFSNLMNEKRIQYKV